MYGGNELEVAGSVMIDAHEYEHDLDDWRPVGERVGVAPVVGYMAGWSGSFGRLGELAVPIRRAMRTSSSGRKVSAGCSAPAWKASVLRYGMPTFFKQ